MQRLVSPERRLHLVGWKCEHDLKALQAHYAGSATPLSAKLLGNLRQLLRWTEVGNGKGDTDDRLHRKESSNWQLLEDIYWLKHDSGDKIVPVVGKNSHIFTNIVAPHPVMSFSQSSLKGLLNGSKTAVGGWRKAAMPAQVNSLADGTRVSSASCHMRRQC